MFFSLLFTEFAGDPPDLPDFVWSKTGRDLSSHLEVSFETPLVSAGALGQNSIGLAYLHPWLNKFFRGQTEPFPEDWSQIECAFGAKCF